MPFSKNAVSWTPGQVTAAQADGINAIVRDHYASLPLFQGQPRNADNGFQHPWKTTSARYTNQKWKVMVNPGTVNDDLALYIYLKQGDPRAWKTPPKFVPPYSQPGTPNLVFRSPFDSDSQWNPPFLLVTAPDSTGRNLGDFIDITHSRPAYFTGNNIAGVSQLGRIGGAINSPGDDISNWPLYQASVVLTASPYPGANQDFTAYVKSLTTQLKKFVLFAGHLPVASDNVDAGGFIELARLYLLRNPSAPLTGDQLYVKQMHFWCLQAIAVQPSFELGTLQDTFDYGDAILGGLDLGLGALLGDIILSDAQNTLDQAQSVSFFTA